MKDSFRCKAQEADYWVFGVPQPAASVPMRGFQ